MIVDNHLDEQGGAEEAGGEGILLYNNKQPMVYR